MTRLWTAGAPIHVDARMNGIPLGFTWRGERHAVEEVVKRWRVDTDWWERHLWREYFKMIASNGLLVIIYRDLLTESWWLQRLYD